MAARGAGWGLVCRNTSTGEDVVVCPDHLQELLDADLRALLTLPSFQGYALGEDGLEETVRLRVSKGSVDDDG